MLNFKIYVGLIDKFHVRYSLSDVEPLVSRVYEGFSITQQWGYYKGKREQSIVIEIFVENLDRQAEAIKAYALADCIKIALNQECVLVSCQEINDTVFI